MFENIVIYDGYDIEQSKQIKLGEDKHLKVEVYKNPDFDYILTTFKRNLLDRIEEIMNEFKNKTIHQVSRDVLEAKEEYLKELPKEDKVKTNTDFDAIVLGIYASYSTEIEANYMINTSFNNLLAFYENNIIHLLTFLSIKKKIITYLLILLLFFLLQHYLLLLLLF